MEILAGARILKRLLNVEPLIDTCPASPENERILVRPMDLSQSETEAEFIELKGVTPRLLSSDLTFSGSQVSVQPPEGLSL